MIPSSFSSIMKEIGSFSAGATELDASQKVLCTLFERFLLYKPTVLVPYLLSRARFNACEVQVLVSILEKRAKHSKITDDLCLVIEEKLFDLFECNKSLQHIVHSKRAIFLSIPLNVSICRLMKLLDASESSSYVSSAASAVLTGVIERSALSNGDAIIAQIVSFLATTGAETESDAMQSRRLSKQLKYTAKWRRTLLTCGGDDAFASILLACGKAMFQDPSNSVVLALLGALLGEGKDLDDDAMGETCNRRIRKAVISLVEVGVSELEKTDAEEANGSHLFRRLSPLLMLRRIPFQYFRLAHHATFNDHNPLEHLANILATKLGFKSDDARETRHSNEERRLSADIAARCLPFSATASSQLDKKSSGFEVFCEQILSSSLLLLKTKSFARVEWKKLKLALYISCHAVQVAPESVGVLDYLSVGGFAFFLLNVEDDGVTESMVEAQTGCIEFLSTCICAIHSFPLDLVSSQMCPNLIEELPDENSNEKLSVPEGSQKSELLKSFEYLTCLRNDMLRLIRGREARLLPPLMNNQHALDDGQEGWSISSRVCLLNAFSIATQRCSMPHLPELANVLVPNLMIWLLDERIGDDIRHPLCVASAMQCVFNCLQRTKTFSSLQTSPVSLGDSVRRLFQASARAIEHKAEQSNIYEQSSMRVAALKLLVVIVSINQSVMSMDASDSLHEVCGYIPPSDLIRVLSILRGVANMDENPDVRKVATHLLSFIEIN